MVTPRAYRFHEEPDCSQTLDDGTSYSSPMKGIESKLFYKQIEEGNLMNKSIIDSQRDGKCLNQTVRENLKSVLQQIVS